MVDIASVAEDDDLAKGLFTLWCMYVRADNNYLFLRLNFPELAV